MTLQEKLEMAARVAGNEVEQDPNLPTCYRLADEREPGEWREWMPHTDDCDSRRLEIALRKYCLADHSRPFSAWPLHIQELWERYRDAADSGDAEQYRAAVLDLAAAIGEVINAA